MKEFCGYSLSIVKILKSPSWYVCATSLLVGLAGVNLHKNFFFIWATSTCCTPTLAQFAYVGILMPGVETIKT